MNSDKFKRLSKRFPFLSEVVKDISCSKINVDEIINHINKIEVLQIGFKILSRTLLNQYWFNKRDSGTEEDNYDYEKLFVIFKNGEVETKSFSALESDICLPIANFFTKAQPKCLVVAKIKECSWHHYYDRIGGRIIYQLEIKIILVDRGIVGPSNEIVDRFWERNSF